MENDILRYLEMILAPTLGADSRKEWSVHGCGKDAYMSIFGVIHSHLSVGVKS